MALNDILNENGLTISSSNEIREWLEQSYRMIYGDDIVLDSNTSDGQLLDILTQMNTDLRERLTELYNQQNPDSVRGVAQDKMYRINNLFRKGGTFTIQTLRLTLTATVAQLQGLDGNYNDVTATAYGFTDNSGMAWYLIDTQENLTAGTHDLLFRCSQMGNITPVLNTIVNPIQIVAGVASATNAIAPLTIGIVEETDEDFATRRQRSTEDRSQNTADSLQSALLDLAGVDDAYVYRNNEDTADSGGIPSHGIWVIIDGGANDDIATAIYSNIAGAGCKGDIEAAVLTTSGQTFVTRFDRAVAEELYIKFEIKKIETDFIYDLNAVKQYIVDNLTYRLNEYADTSKPIAIAQEALNANGAAGTCINLKISIDGSTWIDFIEPKNKKDKFVVSADNITITEV